MNTRRPNKTGRNRRCVFPLNGGRQFVSASCAVWDDVRKAVKFASAAGALACTKFGAIEALPKKAEIIELLQKEGLDVLPGDYRSA